MSERQTGTVKWFDGSKGFGFIEIDGEDKDIFVHHSAIERGGLTTLREGAQVGFAVEEGAKGLPAATQVRPQPQLHGINFGDEALHRILWTDITDGILGG